MLSISFLDKVQDRLGIGHDRHTHHQPKRERAWERDQEDATRNKRSEGEVAPDEYFFLPFSFFFVTGGIKKKVLAGLLNY